MLMATVTTAMEAEVMMKMKMKITTTKLRASLGSARRISELLLPESHALEPLGLELS